MSQLQALLFDLDGTLANTEQANAAAYAEAICHFGGQIDTALVREHVRGQHWTLFLPALLRIAGAGAEAEQVAAYKRDCYPRHLDCLELNHVLLDLIRALKGRFKLGLVTTASRAAVDAIDRRHGLLALFDCVVTGDDVQRPKPSPEAYQLAASHLGLTPEQCLVFEDSDSGVASALGFGAQTLRILSAWTAS